MQMPQHSQCIAISKDTAQQGRAGVRLKQHRLPLDQLSGPLSFVQPHALCFFAGQCPGLVFIAVFSRVLCGVYECIVLQGMGSAFQVLLMRCRAVAQCSTVQHGVIHCCVV